MKKFIAIFSLFVLATFIIGIVLGILNSNLIWGENNQNGRVDIPGSKVLNLPSGSMEVAVAVALPGRGNETPDVRLPKGLSLSVLPTDKGGDKPVVMQDLGTSVNANDDEVDTQIRVWKVDIPSDGDYRVTAKGDFTGYGVNAQLWLGNQPGFLHGGMIWVAAAIIALLGLIGWNVVAWLRGGGRNGTDTDEDEERPAILGE